MGSNIEVLQHQHQDQQENLFDTSSMLSIFY
jgi:hypothetical protein